MPYEVAYRDATIHLLPLPADYPHRATACVWRHARDPRDACLILLMLGLVELEPAAPPEVHQCLTCGRTFKSASVLSRHVNSVYAHQRDGRRPRR